MNTNNGIKKDPKRSQTLVFTLLFLCTALLILSCNDLDKNDDDDTPSVIALNDDDDTLSVITLSGKAISDGLHLGDTDISLSAKLKGKATTEVDWEILDNTDDQYGTISNGVYTAPKVWKEKDFVKGKPIPFTIEATSKTEPSVKVEKKLNIQTDSFPNPLVITHTDGNSAIPDTRADYSSYDATNRNIDIYLGVTAIGDSAFYANGLTGVTIPESVTEIRSTAFGLNQITQLVLPASLTELQLGAFAQNSLADVTMKFSVLPLYDPTGNPPFLNNKVDMRVRLSATLWENIKSKSDLKFFDAARVTSYTDFDGNALTALLGVSANPSNAVAVGSSITLNAKTLPATVAVVWAVDDDSIATINAATGELTGVAAGTVSASATVDGVTKSIEITVTS